MDLPLEPVWVCVFVGVVSTVAVPVEALRISQVAEDCVSCGEAPGDGVIVPCPIVVEARGVLALPGVPVVLRALLAYAGSIGLVVRLVDDALFLFL